MDQVIIGGDWEDTMVGDAELLELLRDGGVWIEEDDGQGGIREEDIGGGVYGLKVLGEEILFKFIEFALLLSELFGQVYFFERSGAEDIFINFEELVMLLQEVVVISVEGDLVYFSLIEFSFQSDDIGVKVSVAFEEQVIG